uniref:DNA binding protein n=1 Tax=Rhizophora mucronata TaxID=61149 RepID=A0A2P2JJI9_RHIMU
MESEITWSRDEDKAFEDAIAMHGVEEDSKEQWEKIASLVPSKSLEALKQHYGLLVDDVSAIEAGNVPLPNYIGEEATSSTKDSHGTSKAVATEKRLSCGYGSGFLGLGHDSSRHGGKGGSRSDQERRKGIPWTEEEHRYAYAFCFCLFLWFFFSS